MKQTNNAIKFLMAQYRAIFKNAYLKGMASALVLTAGLAAGAAQAGTYVSSDEGGDFSVWSTKDSSTWNGSTELSGGSAPGATTAGAAAENGVVSGGKIDVGADYDIKGTQTSGSLIGGVAIDATIGGLNLSATNNGLNLYSGTGIAGSAFGTYVNATKGGSVSATENFVTINAGASESVSVTAVGKSDGIFGARIKTSDGFASASGNYVSIKADSTSNLTLANGGNGIVGALAEGTDGVSVTGNHVDINITTNDPSKRVKLGTLTSIQGGFALNQTSGAVAPTLTAASNSVSGSNFTFGGSGAYIFGGRAMNNGDADAGAELIARDNAVNLSNVAVSSTSDADTDDLQIVGNMAVVYADAAPDSGTNSSSALGDGSKVNLLIDGGTVAYTSSGNAAPGLGNASSMAAGGYAMTNSGGGNALANLNVAQISNITATNVNFYGGIATDSAANKDDQVEASNNTLTLDSSDIKVDTSNVYKNTGDTNHIIGGYTYLNGSDISKASATASGNTMNVTNSKYNASEISTQKSITANLYGAAIETSTSGATVTANQNSVTVGNGLKVTGNVYGVSSVYNGSFEGNSVNFNASVGTTATSGGVIAGVALTSGSSGSVSDHESLSLLNNTVEIGADARITNTSIVAADLADKNATNTDIIHSGNNVIFNGVHVIDDSTASNSYDLAGDDVQIGSSAVIHIKNGALNISGLADGATTSTKYFNGTGSVAAGAKIANAGTINVYNALDIQGNDSLIASQAGALIHVNAGSALEETAEHDPVTEQKATLYITQEALTNYLTASNAKTTLYDSTQVGDFAGTLAVSSGGTVDFKDSVTLNDFSYSSGDATSAAEAGKIHVSDTDLTGGSGAYFRADTVNLEHALVTDTSKLRADLNNIDDYTFDNADAVGIEANTLNLGSSDLSSTRSESIQFGEAIVRDEINFLAATSGYDIKNDGTQVSNNAKNDGYHLTAAVTGSHYMLTNSQDGKLQYYTAQNGVVNGPVTITANTNDNGSLTIRNGNWTANGQITVSSGGTLIVGGDDGIDETPTTIAEGPDATLTLNQALVLDVSENGGKANVTVSGDGSFGDVYDYVDELDGTISAPTERVALLDLRNGLTMQGKGTTNVTYEGSATITATSGGIVLLNADDVNTILAQNDKATAETSGAFFKADNGGAFIVTGDVVADFGDFSESGNGFNLNGTGTLAADKLTVENANDTSADSVHNDADYIESAPTVSFGGTVQVADLEINDLQLTNGGADGKDKPAGAGNYASQVVVADGIAKVSKSLTSYNQTLVLGTDSTDADFEFNSASVSDEGSIAVDTMRVDSGSISVFNGTWTAQNFNLKGEGTSLIVGGDYGEDDFGQDTYATLKANALTMGEGSKVEVKADGTASFVSADFSKLAAASSYEAASVQVAGTLSISDSVKFGAEGSLAIEKNGVLAFGSKATNSAIIADGNYTNTTAEQIKSAMVKGFTKIQNDGGELHLGFSASTNFGGDAIQALKKELFTTNSLDADNVLINGGVLNIGDATFDGVHVSELVGENLSGYTASWDDLKSFSDIFGNDVTNNTLVQTNVSGIKPGDNVQGHWGSLSMVADVAPSAQVEIAGNTSLNFAAGNNGFFISTADHKTALGANIQSQKDLTLENGFL